MKKAIIALAALAVSVGASAQKDELKTLKKIYDRDELSEKDVTEYKAVAEKAKTYLGSASADDKVMIDYFVSQVPFMEFNYLMQKPENQQHPELGMKYFTPDKIHAIALAYAEMREYEKKNGKATYTKDMDGDVKVFGPTLLNFAVQMGNKNQYKEGAQVLHDLYLMDTDNLDNLFYAASYAVKGEDYDTALAYYDELKSKNYSGEGIEYYATEIGSGKEVPFSSKEDRDKMVALKLYVKPREEKIPSKKAEIYKNIALILSQQGKNDEAKKAYADAIKENRDDVSLQVGEANLYLKLKDNETYKQKVAAILAKNPNNADLSYNLGVLALESGQKKDAESYFKKTIEVDPKYANAYLNLATMKLDGDDKIVKEMNSLGTSEKDNKRYDVLKKQRTEAFNDALPYLEKAYELNPNDEVIISNLMSVYNFLEMTDKAKALKAKRDAMQDGK